MRQRVKIAGALVHEPPILLLDEPFNGMDPRQRLHMIDLLRSMAEAGRAILFSSHILEEVERLADGVLVIYAGRLAAAGDFREIRRLMTDRPHTFVVRSSDDRHLAAAFMAEPAVFGTELRDGRLTRPGRRVRRVHAGGRPGRPERRRVALRGRPDRRLARERLRLPREPAMTIPTLAAIAWAARP